MPMTIQRPQHLAASSTFSGRRTLLDMLRGLALVGMILYHFCFNLDSIFHVSLPWFHSFGAAAWQFCNSALFLLIAGICTHLTRHIFQRAIRLALVAIALSLVTFLFMPEELIVFGILHCIAACLLIYGAFQPWLRRVPAGLGMFVCALLFFVTFHLPHQYLFFEPFSLSLPASLYVFYPLSLLGFRSVSFYSADYFPLFPYLFLFLFGHYLGYLVLKLPQSIQTLGLRPLNFLGRHSLVVYLLHQPLLLGGMMLVF